MTLLTIAVMISAMAHAVTPALLPHSHTIAIPTSFGTTSQENTRSFGGYDNPPSYTPQPPFHPPQVAPQPFQQPRGVQAPEGHQHEHGTPYQFRYLVQDENEGVDFNEDKESDGDTIRGEYRVLLPDGRRQIVRYVADSINGYNAVVEYEGNAVYPDHVARALYAI